MLGLKLIHLMEPPVLWSPAPIISKQCCTPLLVHIYCNTSHFDLNDISNRNPRAISNGGGGGGGGCGKNNLWCCDLYSTWFGNADEFWQTVFLAVPLGEHTPAANTVITIWKLSINHYICSHLLKWQQENIGCKWYTCKNECIPGNRHNGDALSCFVVVVQQSI